MKQLQFTAIVCKLFILHSCKKIVPPETRFVNVDKETSVLKGEIDAKDTIYINSNDEWIVTLEPGVDWLSVTPMNGSGDGMIIIATVKQNNTTSRKTTNVEVKTASGNQSRLITVTQLQFNKVLLNAIFGGDGYDAFSDFTTAPGVG